MGGIGQKLKEIRRRKGFSQEELADNAKVNLRTIQRIENNESEPRGTTLNLICEALDILPDDIYDYGKVEDKGYHLLLHLSVLSYGFIPLGNILIPLALWVSKKEKIIEVNSLGANILNFQILWTSIVFIFFVMVILTQNPFVLFLLGLMILINFLFPIALSIAAYKGRDSYYPNLIKFVS
ncbi:transcriptional regulator with XRE-family HTH domain [Saonia flava]|uniref:Transcriptional regulator with XRE-family HTH domain n=1 Tax=Saonia flava TaxID=523696 RepID=A0A846QQW4_9FLAO|nr:helix-turn-helix domain-containing protein [Saonia flava]NJB70498.1 transcriptional regulator with XRE-family HTH domain [Saonia flava]